jgi:hypothetical protein
MLEPTDRTFFPPCLRTLSVGARQRTRGSSPRSPAGVRVLLQGLTTRGQRDVAHMPTGIGGISAVFGGARTADTVSGGYNFKEV